MAKHRRTTLLTVTSAFLALAPKCPVCFLGYFGIFGVTAASASAYRSWLPPLTAISLSVTVGTLALGASRKGRFEPIALGVIGASGVFAGRFIVNSRTMLFGSLLVLGPPLPGNPGVDKRLPMNRASRASDPAMNPHGPKLGSEVAPIHQLQPTYSLSVTNPTKAIF